MMMGLSGIASKRAMPQSKSLGNDSEDKHESEREGTLGIERGA
jgi:hypothetical protein